MRKNIIFLTATVLMLSSCGGTSIHDTWTITFESNGGSLVDPIEVKDGELASKPANPVKDNYTFIDWFVDSYLTVSFDWSKEITSNWTLYASWKNNQDSSSGDSGNAGDNTNPGGSDSGSTGDNTGGDSSGDSGSGDSGSGSGDTGGTTGGDTGGSTDGDGSGSGDSGSGDSGSTGDNTGGDTGGTTIDKGHGPDGSTLVSWYLVGSGSLWDESNGWTVEGGVQLYSNPANSNDKGCILSIPFKVGDKFKVTDGGSTWFGYEKVDTYSGENNKGLTCFTGDSDGYGGSNFKCTVEGTYDMYVNSSGVFWIQDAA